MEDEEKRPEKAEGDTSDVQQEGSSSPQPDQQKSDAKSQRRRTKTGCLTCRKRRIKCGEERPVCANCIKSKRNCEGYNQRVIFKHPLGGDFRGGQGYGPIRHDQTLAGVRAQASGANGLARIAPKAFPSSAHPNWDQQAQSHGPGQNYDPWGQPTSSIGNTNAPHILQPLNISDPTIGYSYHFSGLNPVQNAPQAHVAPSSASAWQGMPAPVGPTFVNDPPYVRSNEMPIVEQSQNINTQRLIPSSNPADYIPAIPSHTSVVPSAHVLDDWHYVEPPSTMSGNGETFQFEPGHFIPSAQYIGNEVSSSSVEPAVGQTAEPYIPQDAFQAVVTEEEDDDLWDVMDEDPDLPITGEASVEDIHLLTRIPVWPGDLEIRGYQTFLNSPNVLARYRPTYLSSPLNDEKTARIFAHFLTATGPSISIFERNITNVGALFSGVSVPRSQQGLWTYVLPSMALESTALMHAVLALGALHIAKLQDTSAGSSLKHFQYALRRVGRLLGLPQRRNEIATVAANLILGFYEVMSAEHSKWSIHLAGAKILIMEMDLATKTVCIRRARDQAKAMIAKMSPPPDMLYRDVWKHTGYSEELLDPLDWEVDDRFVSELSGLHVSFNELSDRIPVTMTMTEKDIHEYKIRSDLFWWYCKQDVFQSMISGNALLMPYEHWTTNPPRSQFGQRNAPYGTFDHMMLLLARLADWGAKDRRRKIKVMAANGGQWRPPPGFFPSRPAGKANPGNAGVPTGQGGPPPDARGPPGPRPAMPSFHGMMPPKPARMESAYASVASNLHDPYRAETVSGTTHLPEPLGVHGIPSQAVPATSMDGTSVPQQSSSNPSSPGPSLDDLTEQALTEHAAITRAFELFHASLPSTFAPLSPNHSPQIASPFGPAIQYRKHSIACTHLFYHCGLLLLARLHPHMPPAAMAATVISASKTAGTAQIMGRIVGGLYHAVDDETPRMATPNDHGFTTFTDPLNPWSTALQQQNDMNPMFGAALMETTFPMFFAAVQYTDPEQRSWTIRKLKAIARIAGWESSAAIAAGCESAWQRIGVSQGQTVGPPPPTSQVAPKDSTPVAGRSVPRDEQSSFGQRPRMAHFHSTGAGTNVSSSSSSSQFPEYVPTVEVKTNDERVAGVWRHRQKILRAQQQQHDSNQSQEHVLRDRATADEQISRATAFQRAASESQVPTLSSYQVGQDQQPVPQQNHVEDDDPDDLPHDDTIPLPINHGRRLIGTNPNARVHWALGILGLEKDLHHLELG